MNFGNVLLILLAARIGFKSISKYILRPRKLKMELVKYTNTDMVKIVDLPDELYEDNDLDISKNEVYQKTYDEFGKVIEMTIPREDLDNYYHNFKTIKETKTSTQHMLTHLSRGQLVGGTYDLKDNLIDLETSKLAGLMNSRGHELLHAASTRIDSKTGIIYSGLSQMIINEKDPKKNEAYGVGINEGVTQYFANKFFNKNHEFIAAYRVYEEEQAIAKALEKIVGEETLRHLYFTADLKGLVDILEKYASREDIYKFINYTDVLLFYSRDKKLKFEELDKVKEFINLFLIKVYDKVMKEKGLEFTFEGNWGLDNYCLPYRTR